MDQKAYENTSKRITAQRKADASDKYYKWLLLSNFQLNWLENKLERLNSPEDMQYADSLKKNSKRSGIILFCGVFGAFSFDYFVKTKYNLEMRKRYQCFLIWFFGTIIAHIRLQKPWKQQAYDFEMAKKYENQLRELNPEIELAFQKAKEEHDDWIQKIEEYKNSQKIQTEIVAQTEKNA